MSINLSISLKGLDAAYDHIAKAGPPTPRERLGICAEIARLVQRHLRQRDSTHAHTYPEGGKRSRFWRKAAESVTFSVDPLGAMVVSVTQQGARLRYLGAPKGISPVNAGALAIPASAAAYGRSPREFSDLDLVVYKGLNKAALVRRTKDSLVPEVMYWLVKRTKPIAPDPTVLPPPHVVQGLALMRLKTMRKMT